MIHTTDINEFEAVFKVADAISVEERELFKAFTGMDFSTEDFLVALADLPGEHFIFWVGETPVAVGGFIPQRPGVERTWFMAPDKSWQDHGRELTDKCRELLEDKLAHRIETVTLADRAKARAWYERIGLTYESTQPGYGCNGEDAVMYVIVRKVEKTECAVA